MGYTICDQLRGLVKNWWAFGGSIGRKGRGRVGGDIMCVRSETVNNVN